MAEFSNDASGRLDRPYDQGSWETKPPLPWKRMFLNSAIGLLFLIINFPHLTQQCLERLGNDNSVCHSTVMAVGSIHQGLSTLAGPHAVGTFQDLLAWIFSGIMVYFVALLIFSVRHQRITLFGAGLVSFGVGVYALHFASWIGVVMITVITACSVAFHWVADHLEYIVKLVWSWLLPVAPYLVGIAALVILWMVISNNRRALVWILAGIPFATLLYVVVLRVWSMVAQLVQTICAWLVTHVFRYIVPVILIVFLLLKLAFIAIAIVTVMFFVLCTFGHLVVDQIKSAWYTGNGHKGVLLSGFGLGTALGLILLTSVANPRLANSVNRAWSQSFVMASNVTTLGMSECRVARTSVMYAFSSPLPKSVRTFVHMQLRSVSAPLYDSIVIILVLALSYAGLARYSVRKLTKEPDSMTVSFMPHEYFSIFGGPILLLLMVLASANSENN